MWTENTSTMVHTMYLLARGISSENLVFHAKANVRLRSHSLNSERTRSNLWELCARLRSSSKGHQLSPRMVMPKPMTKSFLNFYFHRNFFFSKVPFFGRLESLEFKSLYFLRLLHVMILNFWLNEMQNYLADFKKYIRICFLTWCSGQIGWHNPFGHSLMLKSFWNLSMLLDL